jgi:hypothetical protein
MHKYHSGRTNSLLFVLFLFLFFSCSESKKTKHILFVGNSYTYRNNMPEIFEAIARSKGEDIRVSHVTRGKYTFYLHSKRKKLYRALNNENWDVIILQGSSRDMLRDSARFKKRTFPALDKMLGMIRKSQKEAQVYFYMTWPYRNGDPKTERFSDPDSMLEAVAAGYDNLRNRYNGPVIPVGKVWREYTLKYPDANLYLKDNSHPTYEGSYLVACTMYAAIYGKSPEEADKLSLTNQEEYLRIQRFISQQYQTPEFRFYLKSE